MKNKDLLKQDRDDELENTETPPTNTPTVKKEGTSKKIVQNEYNMGTYEFENLGDIKVNSNSTIFADNFFDNYEKKQIKDIIYEIFDNSIYKEKYLDIRRVQKDDIMDIFYLFYRNEQLREFSCIDRFTESCNFFNFDYKYVFYNLLPNEKEIIVKAMDEEYGVLRFNKIKKLF